MVSFSCEVCNDTVIKKKLDAHTQRCRGAYFTCIDCSTTFSGTDYRGHTSCISEAEKYEKALYKGKKKSNQSTPVPVPDKKPQPAVEKKSETIKNGKSEKKSEKSEKSDKKSEKSDKKSEKSASKSDTVSLNKYVKSSSENLYKVVKKISKDNSKDLKDILKQLKVEKASDGSFVISL